MENPCAWEEGGAERRPRTTQNTALASNRAGIKIPTSARRPFPSPRRRIRSRGRRHARGRYRTPCRRRRSEEHTSELQSLMRISYAVFCLKKKQLKQLQYHHMLTSDVVKHSINYNDMNRLQQIHNT